MADIPTPTQDMPTDRVNGISQNPNVPNADGTAYKAPVLRYTGGNSSSSTSTTDAQGNTIVNGLNYGSTPAPGSSSANRVAALNSAQGSIDAINKEFAANSAMTDQNNANMVGGTRARNARTGNLESDFGAANMAGATVKAQQNTDKVNAQHDKELNTIYEGIQKDMDAKDKATQAQQNQLTTVQNKNLRDNAFKSVDALATKGTSLDSLTQDEYNHVIQSTGMSDEELHNYYNGKVPADKILSGKVQNGVYTQVVREANGQVHINNIQVPGVPENYSYNASIQAFVPKDGINPNKPISDQVIPYAKAISMKTRNISTKPVTGAPKGVTQSDIQSGTEKLESAKGSDHYVDPYLYQSMYNHWTSQGGSPTVFFKNYPAKNYINPTDNKLLPSYLQVPVKKSTSGKSTGA